MKFVCWHLGLLVAKVVSLFNIAYNEQSLTSYDRWVQVAEVRPERFVEDRASSRVEGAGVDARQAAYHRFRGYWLRSQGCTVNPISELFHLLLEFASLSSELGVYDHS